MEGLCPEGWQVQAPIQQLGPWVEGRLRRLLVAPSRDQGGHATGQSPEPQTWPEVAAVTPAVNQAQFQLVQNLLLLRKHFFCKINGVQRAGRCPEGRGDSRLVASQQYCSHSWNPL